MRHGMFVLLASTLLIMLAAVAVYAFPDSCVVVVYPIGKIASTDQIVFMHQFPGFPSMHFVFSGDSNSSVGGMMPYFGEYVPFTSDDIKQN